MIRNSIRPLGREVSHLEKRVGVAAWAKGTRDLSATTSATKSEQKVWTLLYLHIAALIGIYIGLLAVFRH
jgi:hypothetical protein